VCRSIKLSVYEMALRPLGVGGNPNPPTKIIIHYLQMIYQLGQAPGQEAGLTRHPCRGFTGFLLSPCLSTKNWTIL
jgi:hypothetical protein